MSQVGYYRYKISDSFEGEQTVKFFINGALASTATIIARPFCPGFRLLKYLDSSGRYRFFAFNKNWQQTDKPTLIGKVNHFVTSIIDSQSDSRNIGYKGERKISLVAEHVSQDEMDKLNDICLSPRIYLYVGNADNIQSWILVSTSADIIGRERKANFRKLTLEITLPPLNAITKV